MSATRFSSRWALVLAMLGMAVGTGNIWRFPRIAATNGGGAFLVAWVIFLLLWSIPLIVTEFAMGKALRRGPVGVFRYFLGDRFAWVGAWIAFVVSAIGFYYAVVMGWTIRFLFAALLGELSGGRSEKVWQSTAFAPASIALQALAVVLAAGVVYFGVSGIERLARLLMPALIVLVVILMIRAVTLPGASAGLEFLFRPQWGELGNVRLWLEALAQNAWDTGAGWSLVLAYALYSRPHEDTNLNSCLLAFGNNAISLMAGILVLCTVFSQRPDAAAEIVGAGNEGLTFVWVPQLFDQIPGGAVFMVLFFLALVFAAWTSFVATFEVGARVLVELGFPRRPTVVVFALVVFLAGLPSALHEGIFRNQDFVWGVALMLTGLAFALAVLHYGAHRFRIDFVDVGDQDLRLGRAWEWAIRLVVLEALIMIVWWFWQQRSVPWMAREGIGNMVLQWGAAAVVLMLLNRWLVKRGDSVADPAVPVAKR